MTLAKGKGNPATGPDSAGHSILNTKFMDNVFVYVEIEGTEVKEVSQELLTKGRKLANELGVELHAVVCGTGIKDKVESQILPYGVDKLFVFDGDGLFPYTSAPHTDILVNLFKEEKPQICLMGATVIGRDLGPRVSSSLTSGLTADCTQLEIGTYDDKKSGKHYDGLLYQIRPAFGGNIVATIVNPDHRPQMATVRSGVMQKALYEGQAKGEVTYPDVTKYVSKEAFVVKVLDRHVEAAKHNLKGSPIVVAGGYGVGSKEGFDTLVKLANALDISVDILLGKELKNYTSEKLKYIENQLKNLPSLEQQKILDIMDSVVAVELSYHNEKGR